MWLLGGELGAGANHRCTNENHEPRCSFRAPPPQLFSIHEHVMDALKLPCYGIAVCELKCIKIIIIIYSDVQKH